MTKHHFLKYDNFSQLLDSSATRVLAVKVRKPAARVKPRWIAKKPTIDALLRVWFTQIFKRQGNRSEKLVLPNLIATTLTPSS